MLAYVTVVGEEVAPLAHFVRWYKYLGVEKFLVTLYCWTGQDRQATKILDAEEAPYEILRRFDEVQYTREHADEFIRNRHTEGEWAFFADIDEFCRADPHIIRTAIRENQPLIGCRCDRTRHDGKLPELDQKAHLEGQFPYGLDFADQCGLPQSPVYVLSNKAPGAHFVDHCKWGMPQIADLRRRAVEVHQFRWHANLGRLLRRRMARMQEQGAELSPRTLRWTAMQLEHIKCHQGIFPPLTKFVGSVIGV